MKIIICGLGNPGKTYLGTRHNVGFAVIDRLHTKYGVEPFQKNRLAHAEVSMFVHSETGKEIILAKPTVFMNLSGASVLPLSRHYGINPETGLCVVHDDTERALGKLSFANQGNGKGHNGIKSIISNLGSPKFVRLRFGVGRPADDNMVRHVLEPFTSSEAPLLQTTIDYACDALLLLIQGKQAMGAVKYK